MALFYMLFTQQHSASTKICINHWFHLFSDFQGCHLNDGSGNRRFFIPFLSHVLILLPVKLSKSWLWDHRKIFLCFCFGGPTTSDTVFHGYICKQGTEGCLLGIKNTVAKCNSDRQCYVSFLLKIN